MIDLLVARHAKSDWETGRPDHDRPLAPRGIRAAAKVGGFLAAAGKTPQLALSSTAERAQATAEALLAAVGNAGKQPPRLVTEQALYGASIDSWCSTVQRALIDHGQRHQGYPERTLVVGHEPTCSGVVRSLTGADCRFPTGAVACIRVADPSTMDAEEDFLGPGILQFFLIPRLLD